MTAPTVQLYAEYSSAEKDASEYVNYCITHGDTQELQTILEKISPIQFYRLTLILPAIHTYCSTSSVFDATWQTILANNQCPSLPIQSMDQKEHIKLYDLIIALAFYQTFLSMNARDPKRIEVLNKACDLGLYSALIVRIKTHISIIKNQGTQPKGEEALKKLMIDTKRLSNLYWRLGYLQSAYFFRDISNHFYDLHLTMIDTDAEVILEKAQYFSLIAVHNFLCAGFLIENAASNQIWQNIPDGKIIDSQVLQQQTPKTWTDQQAAFFLEKLGVELYEKIYTEAQAEISGH